MTSKPAQTLRSLKCYICYFDLLSFDKFFGGKKISLLKSNWLMKICIFIATRIFSSNCNVPFFIRHFVFRRQPAEFLFSTKFVKWKQVKITNMILLRKGLDTVESLSAGAARDPNRNMGTVIIIYIFVTFTHSNIDFHKLLMRISGTLHSSLSCYYGLDPSLCCTGREAFDNFEPLYGW